MVAPVPSLSYVVVPWLGLPSHHGSFKYVSACICFIDGGTANPDPMPSRIKALSMVGPTRLRLVFGFADICTRVKAGEKEKKVWERDEKA